MNGQPLRVLAISHSCVVGANQQVYEELARHPDVALGLLMPSHYVSDFDGSRIVPDRTVGNGFRILTGRPVLAGNGSLYFYLTGLTRAVRETRPAVTFLDEEPWSLSALQAVWRARRAGSRVVFYSKQNLKKPLPPPFRQIQAAVFRATDHAFAISDEVAGVLRWKGYGGPVTLLPHGVDPARFSPRNVSGLRARLGLTGTVFAYFGRLVPEKGVEVFLRAALRLATTDGDRATFWVVGSGPEEGRLRALVEGKPGRFIFLPKVPHLEVAEYLSAADVVVIPSLTIPRWKEQFGRVIIEALACGVPVIGSDSGEIPHLIRKVGGGLVTPEGDAEALAAVMAGLLADPERLRHLAETGRRAVLEAYTNAAVAATMRTVFQQVARETRM
jgi:glycosyltransferase involved in cell wall biosynthesis